MIVHTAEPSVVSMGLRDSSGLDAVEATMTHLATGLRFDRLGSMVREHLGGGGKRTRARVALAAVEALGLDRTNAIAWASACELLHNATLVHDDIQDGDRWRRGRPSLWARHGVPQAINAGDLMLMLPFLAVQRLTVDERTRGRLVQALARRSVQTLRGQALELELVAGRHLDWRSWTAAAEGKSGALLALPVEGAGILAGLADASSGPLATAFGHLGVIYQMYDDIRDLWGDKGRLARGNDLREGKASALVIAHLEIHPEDEDAMVDLLVTPRELTTDGDVAETIMAFERSGALRSVRARIDAQQRLVRANPALRAIPSLWAIADHILDTLEADAVQGS